MTTARGADLPRPAEARWTRATKARLVLEILRSYALVQLVLPRRPITDAVAILRRRARAHPIEPATRAEAFKLSRATVRVLSVLPTDSRCLMRSLTLTALLERRRFETTLVVAARTVPEFSAHAWLERDGEPLLPPGDDRYGRLLEV